MHWTKNGANTFTTWLNHRGHAAHIRMVVSSPYTRGTSLMYHVTAMANFSVVATFSFLAGNTGAAVNKANKLLLRDFGFSKVVND